MEHHSAVFHGLLPVLKSQDVYKRQLVYEARLAPWEAVLGGKIKVPTLEGTVELSVPAGTGSGKKMRLRGKGLGPVSSRGDLYVRIGIDAPKDLTPRQRELWEALAAAK